MSSALKPLRFTHKPISIKCGYIAIPLDQCPDYPKTIVTPEIDTVGINGHRFRVVNARERSTGTEFENRMAASINQSATWLYEPCIGPICLFAVPPETRITLDDLEGLILWTTEYAAGDGGMLRELDYLTFRAPGSGGRVRVLLVSIES